MDTIKKVLQDIKEYNMLRENMFEVDIYYKGKQLKQLNLGYVQALDWSSNSVEITFMIPEKDAVKVKNNIISGYDKKFNLELYQYDSKYKNEVFKTVKNDFKLSNYIFKYNRASTNVLSLTVIFTR